MDDAASRIKSQISMMDAAKKYGIQVNNSGFALCPFHDEKTPSLKLYSQPGKGFACFGCGASGSVIDFVMRLYKIGFRQAVLRIGSDFGIMVNASPAGIKEIRRRQMEVARRARNERERDAAVQVLIEEHCRCWRTVMDDEPWTDRWCAALERMPIIDYELEGLCTPKMIT